MGEKKFNNGEVEFERTDFVLKSHESKLMQCSLFAPKSDLLSTCIVYMHGNASCRLEGLEYAETLMQNCLSVFVYDAAGCGLSEGEYITLGWREHKDLALIVEHLHSLKKFDKIVLWGRSMGAVTALMYLAEQPSHQEKVACAVLDSGFNDLAELMKSVAGSNPALQFFAGLFIPQIKKLVLEKTGMQIDEFKVAPKLKAVNSVPAYFLHGKDDDFVLPSNSEQNHAAYACERKTLRFVPGDHNGERPVWAIREILDFIATHTGALEEEPKK